MELESTTPAELTNTGERFLPGSVQGAEVAYDHLTRYHLAKRYVEDKRILDLGCGAGYGTHMLAGVARDTLGVDIFEEAIAYATKRYQQPLGLRYEVGDVTNLPYEEGSFESAISFEVIEHLQHPEELVLEAKRLLKEDGIFVVSSPDKQAYTNERHRANPYHLSEMYALEFRELLEKHFKHVQIYYQGALAGSVITPDPEKLPDNGQAILKSAKFSLQDPAPGDEFPSTLFMIAVCTDGSPPEPTDQPLMLLDRDRQIYEEHDDWRTLLGQIRTYHKYVRATQSEEKNKLLQQANKRREEMSKRLQEANRELQRLRDQMSNMQSSRGWKVARRINLILTGVRRILGENSG